MGTADHHIMTVDSEAIEWAREYVVFDQPNIVSEAPWARTLNLTGSGNSAYLKLLPPSQRDRAEVWQRLSTHFPTQLPTVLAAAPDKGWLLTADHGSRELDYDAKNEDLCAVLQTYASLQADAAADLSPFQNIRQIEFAHLVPRLLSFLAADANAGGDGRVGAAYFLGEAGAQEQLAMVERHADRLTAFLHDAPQIPLTLNHGDLRPPNTALRADGTVVMLDWDDVTLGPAGLSLHGLFGGCVRAALLLGDSPVAKAASGTPAGLMVRAYLDKLVQRGYATEPVLRRALPASMCAGLIQFVLDFAAYPGDKSKDAVAHTMSRRLSDLLDLCDWLTASAHEPAMELARFYESHAQHERAQALFRDQVARDRENVTLIAAWAQSCVNLAEWDEARECYEEILRLAPGQPAALLGIAQALRAKLQLDEAEKALRRAAKDPACRAEAEQALARVHSLRAMREDAAQPSTMPTLRLAPINQRGTSLEEEEVALGAELFRSHGTLQIENAFPTELIEALQSAFFERYSAYFKQANHPDALYLGDKRYMLTIDMQAPFDSAGLLEAPAVLPIIRRLLGDGCVLGAFTAVISLPGSSDQDLHKDHPALFPDTEWHFSLPPFATQIIVPLVPLDEWTGTTRFFKGSHRVPTEQAETLPHQDPQVPLGGCLLMDYRCAHHGLGNRSDRVRPILTLIFNRPWFRDYRNYGKQPPLRFEESSFGQWPEELQSMVDWWREERKVAGLAHAALSEA